MRAKQAWIIHNRNQLVLEVLILEMLKTITKYLHPGYTEIVNQLVIVTIVVMP